MSHRNTCTIYIESQNVFGSQDIKNTCQEWKVEANRNLISKKGSFENYKIITLNNFMKCLFTLERYNN